jgi:hypothetical protein
MTDASGRVQQGKTLQTQIDELGGRMDAGFRELKEMFRDFEERVRVSEQREAGCQPVVQARIDAAWRKIDEHTSDIKCLNDTIKAMTETISALRHTNRILTWLGGVLGGVMATWFLMQILGLIK